ncbi:MarR family winged helix-turn-helix transcriptional regulator [Rhodosalinus sp.]|uniref:MarR family winged helix-turn-helix transcriptional regulator n=1 Tax=Rhodosalinus sp. TaxID=2047741 RepID=UPI00397D364B
MRLFDIPVRRLAERFRALVERDALRGAEIDLAEWRVVFCLVQDGPLRPNVLALRAVVPPRRIGRMLAGLQRRGLVARRIDPFDRRRAVVEATERGAAVYRDLRPRIEAIADEFRALYTDAEYVTLMKLLERSILRAEVMLGSDRAGRGAPVR